MSNKINKEQLEKVNGGNKSWENSFAGTCPICHKSFTYGQAKIGGECAAICPDCDVYLE